MQRIREVLMAPRKPPSLRRPISESTRKKQETVAWGMEKFMETFFAFATGCMICLQLEKEGRISMPIWLSTALTMLSDFIWNYVDCTDGVGAIFDKYNGEDSLHTTLRLLNVAHMFTATTLHVMDEDDPLKAAYSSISFGVAMVVSLLPHLVELLEKVVKACQKNSDQEANARLPLLPQQAPTSLKGALLKTGLWATSAAGAAYTAADILKAPPALGISQLDPRFRFSRTVIGLYSAASVARAVGWFWPKKAPSVSEESEAGPDLEADGPGHQARAQLVAGEKVSSVSLNNSKASRADERENVYVV